MARIKSVTIVPTRQGTYMLDYTDHDGKRPRPRVKTQKEATFWKDKFELWLAEGKDPVREMKCCVNHEKIRSVTVRTFFPVFMERHGSQQSKNMRISYSYSFQNVCKYCPDLADSQLRDISKSMVLDYMHGRMSKYCVSAATANREKAFISSMLSCAMDWEIINHNPLEGMKSFREAPKREVRLTKKQAEQLISLLPEPMANIVEFAIYSGFRKENILSLRIENVEINPESLTGKVWLTVKGNRREIFPLCLPAVEIIERVIGNRSQGYVFINPSTGTRYKSIHKTFNRAVLKLGLTVSETKFRFHDLRHVFGTWMAERDRTVDLLTASYVLSYS